MTEERIRRRSVAAGEGSGRGRERASAWVALLLLMLCGVVVAPMAHHGFGDYDPAKRVTLTGSVVRFANENPHAPAVIRVEGEETGVEQSLRDARPPLPGESAEDWVLLGTKLHGGFGSYIALGVHIGLDARERLGAPSRSYDVTLQNGKAAPCACLADGLQLSTGATPGRGSLQVLPGLAAGDVFAVVTIKERPSGRTLTYTVPGAARELLDQWNKIPAAERLPALRTVPSSELYERVEHPKP